MAKKKSDEKKIEEGKAALRRDYYASIDSFAKEILSEAAEQHGSFDEAREWIDQQVHETADGSSWVIYTGRALDVLVASDNWTAVDDAGMDLGDDLTSVITMAAYFAVRQDLWDRIDAYEDEYFREENPGRRSKTINTKKVRSKLLR